ncbi:MAG: hypothetical protein WDO73_34190 [Ignavibacteriota bacterium]
MVGDYLCEKYGDLAATPLTIKVEDSRLREAHCENCKLESEFWNYCHTDEFSDRVGEFAIGTNIGVHDVIGNILQDEKIPGITSPSAIPMARIPARIGTPRRTSTWWGRQFDIWIDGTQIMQGGAFLFDTLAAATV